MIRPPPISTLFPYTTLFRSYPVPTIDDIEVDADTSTILLRIANVKTPVTLRVDEPEEDGAGVDRKSTRLNSSHLGISYAVFCLKKKKKKTHNKQRHQ